MTQPGSSHSFDAPATYRIVVAGHLNPTWSSFFDGMTVSTDRLSDDTPVTTLRGILADQSALFGLLTRIQSVGLPLIAVWRDGLDDTAM